MRIRAMVARLSDEDLSDFFSVSVVRDGLVIRLCQLVFILFSRIQCHNEAKLEGNDWGEYKMSLYSQTGLGGLVGLYTILKLFAGVLPRKHRKARRRYQENTHFAARPRGDNGGRILRVVKRRA